jgi:hypothetical protein
MSRVVRTSVGRLALTIVLVLLVFFVVAFLVYGGFSAVTGLKSPSEASPPVFLSGVLVVKAGHSIAFVLLFYLARDSFTPRWLTYAFIWWLIFVIGEIGQAIGFNYSAQEAVAGIISETLYFPAAAFVTRGLVGTNRNS